jgi:hypothetical protein
MKTGPHGKICSTPVDGPHGPARKLKKGMLVLAKETGAFFIPMACSGKGIITFSKAWDQTILPLPFSEVFLDFHLPFKILSNLSESELEEWRVKVEDILNQLTDRVDRIAGYCGQISACGYPRSPFLSISNEKGTGREGKDYPPLGFRIIFNPFL